MNAILIWNINSITVPETKNKISSFKKSFLLWDKQMDVISKTYCFEACIAYILTVWTQLLLKA